MIRLKCVYCGIKAARKYMTESTVHPGKWCCRMAQECIARRMPWQ